MLVKIILLRDPIRYHNHPDLYWSMFETFTKIFIHLFDSADSNLRESLSYIICATDCSYFFKSSSISFIWVHFSIHLDTALQLFFHSMQLFWLSCSNENLNGNKPNLSFIVICLKYLSLEKWTKIECTRNEKSCTSPPFLKLDTKANAINFHTINCTFKSNILSMTSIILMAVLF